MTLQRVSLVSWHVFKESVRDRVLYGIAAFALVLVAASFAIAEITAGQDLKVVKDLGLAVIELAGLLMTIFIGVGLVAREIERRSIFSLLAKPLPRWEFILGKYLGLVLTVIVNVLGMTVALYLMLAWMGWTSPENVRLSWPAPAADPRIMLAVLMIALELSLLTAVALLFSTFSSSALMSIIFTSGIYIAGTLSRDLRGLASIDDSPMAAQLVSFVGWLLPAFDAFDIKGAIVHGRPVGAAFVAYTAGYALIYVTVVLALAATIFSRREFK